MLTALPDRMDWKRDPLGPTNRLRTEGTRNLIAAARAAGARRFVAESVAFFYAPQGGWVKAEEDPLQRPAEEPFRAAASALADLERQALEAEDLAPAVLRFGWLYGPGTHFARDGWQAEEARRRRLPIVGRGDGVFSFVQVEDAAAATVRALERSATGVFNVVDDEPAPMREWVPLYADAVGAKPPLKVPAWLARLVAGKAVVRNALELRGASNARARGELGWQPSYPSWRQGFREALG
jgi:nucleoside-diphosphate-sugar epimerase